MPVGRSARRGSQPGCAMLSSLLRNSLSRALPVVAAVALVNQPLSAQQSSMAMTKPDTTRVPTMSVVPDPLGVPMDRMGSGTTWMPDAVSLPSRHYTAGQWDLMVHGFVFVEENVQGGPRGASQFGSLNWGMFMARPELAGGRFPERPMR